MKIPIICLVGRTNVGKSAIFNRVANQRVKSLVFDKEHVTRDYIESLVTFENRKFLLVDTGGIFIQATGNMLDELAKDKAFEVIKKADKVIFICDAKIGLIEQDLHILKTVRKLNSDITLVINKVDNDQLEDESFQFQRMGVKDIFCTSAVHGRGINEMLAFVVGQFPENVIPAPVKKKYKNDAANDFEDEEDSASSDAEFGDELLFKVAIVGKPNVGKSSLLNLLSHRDRSIVSDIEGTTRESISVHANFNHQVVELMDTPGIRRQASVNEVLEEKMVKSALASIRASDIVLIMIDGSKGELCNQDLKLLSYAIDCKKAVLFIINKVDLIDEMHKVSLEYDIERYDFMLKKVQIIRTSCVDKKGICKIFNALDELWKRCKTQYSTDKVTEIIKVYLTHRPLYKQGRLIKVFKVRFVKARVPTFQLYVNEPKLISDSELSCIENVLRKNLDMRGCPVVIRTIGI